MDRKARGPRSTDQDAVRPLHEKRMEGREAPWLVRRRWLGVRGWLRLPQIPFPVGRWVKINNASPCYGTTWPEVWDYVTATKEKKKVSPAGMGCPKTFITGRFANSSYIGQPVLYFQTEPSIIYFSEEYAMEWSILAQIHRPRVWGLMVCRSYCSCMTICLWRRRAQDGGGITRNSSSYHSRAAAKTHIIGGAE